METCSDDLVLSILEKLEPIDVSRFAQVNKWARRVAYDQLLWRSFCLRTFGFARVKKYSKDWHDCYIQKYVTIKKWEKGRSGEYQLNFLRGHENYISALLLLNDGNDTIVTASADNSIGIWNAYERERKHTLQGHTAAVTCLTKVGDGSSIFASGSDDSTVRLWDSMDGRSVQTLSPTVAPFTSPVQCLSSNGNSLFCGLADGSARHWLIDPTSSMTSSSLTSSSSSSDASDQSLRQIFRGTQSPITCLAVVKGLGRARCLISGSEDSSLAVWPVNTEVTFAGVEGRRLLYLNGHTGSIQSIFSLEKSNHAVSCSADRTIRLWDVSTGALLHTYTSRSPISSSGYDGQSESSVVTGHEDSSIHIWDFRTTAIASGGGRALATKQSGQVNSLQVDSYKIVSGVSDDAINVWDLRKAEGYSLLSGSRQRQRGGRQNRDHPTRNGCQLVAFDESKIVGAFGSVANVYSFE
mmetsp:Transcript_4818/g.7494  ORF Transcript_4818/g.7494 Transcript_4818/m.7494 type:complete len:467 (+) Transcript_4818:60-1460(+)